MVKVVIDASKAPEQQGFQKYEGPTPPNGLYKVRLSQAWWGMSKGSNGKDPKPMMTLVLEFRAKTEDKKKYDGYAIWLRMTHQESMLWKWKQLFAALGQPERAGVNVSDKDGPFGKIITHIGRAQIGKAEMLVKTKPGSYQGQERLDVDVMSPLPGVEVDESYEEDEATSFDEAQSMTENWESQAHAETPDDPWAHEEKWDTNPEDVPF